MEMEVKHDGLSRYLCGDWWRVGLRDSYKEKKVQSGSGVRFSVRCYRFMVSAILRRNGEKAKHERKQRMARLSGSSGCVLWVLVWMQAVRSLTFLLVVAGSWSRSAVIKEMVKRGAVPWDLKSLRVLTGLLEPASELLTITDFNLSLSSSIHIRSHLLTCDRKSTGSVMALFPSFEPTSASGFLLAFSWRSSTTHWNRKLPSYTSDHFPIFWSIHNHLLVLGSTSKLGPPQPFSSHSFTINFSKLSQLKILMMLGANGGGWKRTVNILLCWMFVFSVLIGSSHSVYMIMMILFIFVAFCCFTLGP